MRRRLALRAHLIELHGEATRGNLIGGFCPCQTTTNDDNRGCVHRPTASRSTASAVIIAVRSADVPAYPLLLSCDTVAATASWYLHVGHCQVTPCFFVCFSSIYAAAQRGQACGTGRCQSENVQRG